MALNAKKAPKATGTGTRVEQEALEVGSYEARVVGICDMGLQSRDGGQYPKPPITMIRITYELADEFMVDKDGNELEDKPRWLSEEIPFYNLDVDLGASTKRYRAIDPDDTCDGDFTKLVGMPCMLGVGQYAGKNGPRNKVTGVSTITKKKVAKMPELVNEPQVFLLDDPDMELFNQFPDWLKEKLTSNLEFNGSPLDVALNGEKAAKPTEEAPEEVEEEEVEAQDEQEDGEEEEWLD